MLNQGVQHESVYLEERTRLLLETVRAQRATIVRQPNRIDRFERNLSDVCEQSQTRQRRPATQKQKRGCWAGIKEW